MVLQVEGLRCGYGDLEVIHDFSMRLDEDKISCIIGPNGSGKSTILKAIAGLIKPRGGRIMFDGRDVTRLEPWERGESHSCLKVELHFHS